MWTALLASAITVLAASHASTDCAWCGCSRSQRQQQCKSSFNRNTQLEYHCQPAVLNTRKRLETFKLFNSQCSCVQLMLVRSMPSCTISHRGLISRSRVTCRTHSSTAKSISARVVKRPMPKRIEVCARSSLTPIARST